MTTIHTVRDTMLGRGDETTVISQPVIPGSRRFMSCCTWF